MPSFCDALGMAEILRNRHSNRFSLFWFHFDMFLSLFNFSSICPCFSLNWNGSEGFQLHLTSVSMRVCFQKKIQIWKQRLSSSVLLNIQILISVPQAIIFPPLLFCRIPHGSHIIISIHQQLGAAQASVVQSFSFVTTFRCCLGCL